MRKLQLRHIAQRDARADQAQGETSTALIRRMPAATGSSRTISWPIWQVHVAAIVFAMENRLVTGAMRHYRCVMDVMIRRASNRDREIAFQIVDRALRDYGLEAVLERADRDLSDLAQHYDARGGGFELIELGGEAVGVVGWRPAGDGVFELKKLYLLASARGQGLGRHAAARVIERARASGARAVVLE